MRIRRTPGSRRTTLLLASALVPALPPATQAAPEDGVVREVAPGPWGHVRYVSLRVTPPAELVRRFTEEPRPLLWYVMIPEQEQAARWLREQGLDPERVTGLMSGARPTLQRNGWILTPPPEWIQDLSPDLRARLYGALGQWRENMRQHSPFRIDGDQAGDWRDLCGLTGEPLRRFESMTYRRGSMRVFADLAPMLDILQASAILPTGFLRCISSESTHLATLRVMPGDDVDALVRYWSVDGREEEVRALIEASARSKGAIDVPVPLLLPGFARQVLYTYPEASDIRYLDCHYSSINFLNTEADPKLQSAFYRDAYFNAFFRSVPAADHLGDVLILFAADGTVMHSCVHVAGDLVFTKNGGQITQPWTLMRLEDVIEFYSITGGGLTTRAYRRIPLEGR